MRLSYLGTRCLPVGKAHKRPVEVTFDDCRRVASFAIDAVTVLTDISGLRMCLPILLPLPWHDKSIKETNKGNK
jgi:hypothetical protein